MFLFNTGAARFDVFQGPFTRDDQLTVIPFENGMWFIEDLDMDLVQRVLERLNSLPGEPEVAARSMDAKNARILRDSFEESAYRRAQSQAQDISLRPISHSNTHHVEQQQQRVFEASKQLSFGYVTQDLCGSTPGDDTPHRPLPAFDIPDFVLSVRPEGSFGSSESEGARGVDLVFYVCPASRHSVSNGLLRYARLTLWSSEYSGIHRAARPRRPQ